MHSPPPPPPSAISPRLIRSLFYLRFLSVSSTCYSAASTATTANWTCPDSPLYSQLVRTDVRSPGETAWVEPHSRLCSLFLPVARLELYSRRAPFPLHAAVCEMYCSMSMYVRTYTVEDNSGVWVEMALSCRRIFLRAFAF